ncbi:uncharacterized protein Z519_07665 [Cladophialophora bantiana CBS 173.52]|uniref:Uncharacterized protein n=1 Tax=Cladophialophora bantiana (strain ATCC 10958 / CBS 173.52 / CDC B-1940 / NIH 8579) TaxID=1442370 RepID=A0A0D2FZ09_CLAB1|nr:uncharacterized protein Z519_07665 [Cladophialophora bantiana CBS 173.52]KIW91697.1 hypothetical protein Z519_07665 [Cladophialophora bantiana CBS 173.52]
MAANYTYSGPVNCTREPNVGIVKGKTVIITGGANGIGAVYTKNLVQAGAYVMIGDLDTKNGEALASSLPEGHVWVCRCDVTNWDDQVKLFEEAISKSPSGRVDVVVANAGVAGTDGVFADDSAKDKPEKPNFKIIDVNLTGGLYTIKLALYHFRKQNQRDIDAGKPRNDTSLVIQGSMAGYLDMPGSVLYAASKFGLRGAMTSLRYTGPQHKTRVNLIAPWFIYTGMIPEQFTDLIASKGIVWASIQDAAGALVNIISDTGINSRTFAIVPRKWSPRGYLDIDRDDFKEGERLKEWQDLLLSLGDKLSNFD